MKCGKSLTHIVGRPTFSSLPRRKTFLICVNGVFAIFLQLINPLVHETQYLTEMRKK